MGFPLFLLWLAVTIYSLTSIAILILAGIRYLWSLLPEDSEVADRQARIEHDRAIVQAGRVPGARR
jgi:hypothetical protein